MGRPRGSKNTSKAVAPKTGKKSAAKAQVAVQTAQVEVANQSQDQAMTAAQGQGDIESSVSQALFGAPQEEKKSKKKTEELPERDTGDVIADLKIAINKQFKGRAILRQGSEITNVFILRRPSGIVTLDLAIGGGFPAGGLTQIIGRYSSTKSWLCNRVMAIAQQNYGQKFAASVCMTEQRFDKAFAKTRCGLRVAYSKEEIELGRYINAQKGLPDYTPEYVTWLEDQVGYFTESIAANAEALLEMAVLQVEANVFQVVMIDSFGALLTKAEAEAEEGLEQKYRGGASMVITQFMHRLHAALNLPDSRGRPNTTTVIGINQARDNIGATYGPSIKAAGGHALAHGKLLDIHVEQGARIREPISPREQAIVGKEINWEILKGKAGCHDGPKGTYKFYFGENGYHFGIDSYADILIAGLRAGIVTQSGSWYAYKGEYIGQGEKGVANTLYQKPEIYRDLYSEIYKTSGIGFIVKEI